ncbi:ectoine/hydroxyectoine ABC transporter permease subunit EhuC, partial [Mesorhizobium sp. M00.F.Ca.ET.038.03.1.1]
MDLHKLVALDVLPQLLKGAAVTLEITLLTAVLALVLSFVIGLLRFVSNPWVKFFTTAYVEILRGTSAIVQLYYLFFILPAFGVSLPPTATAV